MNSIYEVETVSATAKCQEIEPAFITSSVRKQANGRWYTKMDKAPLKDRIYVRLLRALLTGYVPPKSGGTAHLLDKIVHE